MPALLGHCRLETVQGVTKMSLLQQVHAGNRDCVSLAESSSAAFALHARDRHTLARPFNVVVRELSICGEVGRCGEFKRRERFRPALTDRNLVDHPKSSNGVVSSYRGHR